MNPTNICSLLDIPVHNFADTYNEIYMMQYRSQLAYAATGKQAAVLQLDPISVAKESVYWFFAVADECKELMDWFTPNNQLGYQPANIDIEIQMESIDIIHFVFNLGLVLGITADEISQMESEFVFTTVQPMLMTCKPLVDAVISDATSLIDLMPWKTWKTYPQISVPDLKNSVFSAYTNLFKSALAVCAGVHLDRLGLVNMFCAKNGENKNRQNNGY